MHMHFTCENERKMHRIGFLYKIIVTAMTDKFDENDEIKKKSSRANFVYIT